MKSSASSSLSVQRCKGGEVKRVFLAVACCLGLFHPAFAAAQMRIGFVNAERVTRESAPAQRAMKRLEKEFERRQAELKKLDTSMQSLQTVLEKNSSAMPDIERRGKEREFSDISRDFQRKERALREDYAQRQNEELAGIQDQANRVIQQIAEREKFDLILQEAVYFSPTIDITEKVLKALSDAR
jgi:outer membrane protein